MNLYTHSRQKVIDARSKLIKTVVYPLAVQLNNTELRYSLRSIEKYLQGNYEVVIVGSHVPDWITNVTQIHLPDVPGRKQLSIKRKIIAALEYSPEILFLNDDVYLLEQHTRFPYYYYGDLTNYAESGAKPLLKTLTERNKPLKNFDGHYPLVYNSDFRDVVREFPEDTIIKSMYANHLEIEGEYIPDCKVTRKSTTETIREFIKDKPCFSTGLHSIESALPVLQELFPSPSIYEV